MLLGEVNCVLWHCTCLNSIFGGVSGRPATPGTCSERRANLTVTDEPERPRSDLAALSPSQPSVVAPSMLKTCHINFKSHMSQTRMQAHPAHYQKVWPIKIIYILTLEQTVIGKRHLNFTCTHKST